MKVLVTGGAGFIGHHLVAALLENNCQVNILDTKQVSDEKVEHLVKLGGNYFHGDITNYSDIAEAGTGCNHIVHLAAQTSVPESIQNPKLNNQVNIEGTKNVIRFANENNIEKLVFSSSAAIYGDCRLNPIKENIVEKFNLLMQYPNFKMNKTCSNYSMMQLAFISFVSSMCMAVAKV